MLGGLGVHVVPQDDEIILWKWTSFCENGGLEYINVMQVIFYSSKDELL